MKAKIYTYIKASVAAVALFAAPFVAQAQQQGQESMFSFDHNNKGKMFFTADWQMNTMSNDFVSNSSGWGANMELNQYITNQLAVGVFFSWHTNNEYHPTATYLAKNNTTSITDDMYRSIFQTPFGASIRYDFMPGKMVVPYIAAKIGTNYIEASTYTNLFQVLRSSWGFYASPELGMSIFPQADRRFGFHVGVYYGYSSNSIEGLGFDLSGINNYGVRLGGTFKF